MQRYFKTNLIGFGKQIGDDVCLCAFSDSDTGFDIIVRFGFFTLPQFKDKIMLMSMPVSIAVNCGGKCQFYGVTKEALFQLALNRNGKTYESYVEEHKDDLSVYQEFMRASGDRMTEALKEDIENLRKKTGGKK